MNHYHGLRVLPGRIEDTAVIDRAEIPTLQARGRDDAAGVCGAVAGSLRARADGEELTWRVTESRLTHPAGQAGLRTTRISCSLRADADLADGGAIEFSDGYGEGRLGWREVTATAAGGVRLAASDVPGRSVSDELRRYPDDLLAAPLDVRGAVLRVEPGAATGAGAPAALASDGMSWLAGMDQRLASFAARDGLTVPVGLAAVALSLLLGAAHAALPGHGKTVMAACMAGRRGGVRDAMTVGATVTFTHTAGVLLLGLLLTVSATLAADRLLSLLGVVSGVLVVGVGVMLLRGARVPHGHAHGHGHTHGHGDGHTHGPGEGHAHGHGDGHTHGPGEGHSHGPGEGHTHGPGEGHTHGPGEGHSHGHQGGHAHGHTDGHSHGPGAGHSHRHRRRTLLGMGVAGGLVPSPSALVVLLGAVALNRTAFGVALVLGYGLGMAVVLTAAGLLVARFGDRAERLLARKGRALWLRRLRARLPQLTAALVIAVGAGLAVRSAVPLLGP
ncbi:nickel transporter [Streptomyces monticola]|uniref:Nickel transporter n=1 Tax=Streptomyces monticola TaxID=2666263 RepID=A0ABW2JWT9_9ACTN